MKDGALFLPSPNRTSFTGLRTVRKADVVKLLETWKRSEPETYRLSVGIAQMQRAYESRDEAAFRESLDIVWKWVPHFGTTSIKPLCSEKDWMGANVFFSRLMSNLLQSARFIFMQDNAGQLLPGLYCPDWKIAVAAFIGTGSVRLCLRCRKIFVPKADNQEYCTPAHREAYRMSRWRSRKLSR